MVDGCHRSPMCVSSVHMPAADRLIAPKHVRLKPYLRDRSAPKAVADRRFAAESEARLRMRHFGGRSALNAESPHSGDRQLLGRAFRVPEICVRLVLHESTTRDVSAVIHFFRGATRCLQRDDTGLQRGIPADCRVRRGVRWQLPWVDRVVADHHPLVVDGPGQSIDHTGRRRDTYRATRRPFYPDGYVVDHDEANNLAVVVDTER